MHEVKTAVEHHHGVEIPTHDAVVYTDNPRAWVIAKIRELADRMESGDLNGSMHQWNDSPEQPAFVMVEVYHRPHTVNGEPKRKTLRLSRIVFKPEAERPKPALSIVKEV